ncbi:MAG: pyridoxamine 5'-phosphate oxidase family protein [Ginsengibacter sp.]
MFDTLSNKQIIDLVSNNVVGRLGCHVGTKIYVVPISYAYDGDYIYARTFEGMKLTMMRKNPNVCFQVDKMESMADWKSVIIWGTFEELTDVKEREKALKILLSRILPNVSSNMVKLTPEWPFPTNDFRRIDGIVFRIHIKEMTGRCEKLDSELYKR